MSALQNLRTSLSEAWESVAEGWQHFYHRASRALTRFKPSSEQTDEHLPVLSGWELLASDVYEDEDRIVVRLEAPGLENRDFNISVIGDTLVVRGDKRFEREYGSGSYQVIESAYGSFERAIPLWTEVDISKAKATYKKGVLRVELPKTVASRRRTVEVEVQ
jgi:HSP20 family protein